MGWSGLPWPTDSRSKLTTTVGMAYFVRTDWAGIGKQLRVLCYQYGGESRSGLDPVGSPANWRCVALEKLSGLTVSGRRLAHSAESFAAHFLRGRSRYRRGGSS
jgi:hypothetical protein